MKKILVVLIISVITLSCKKNDKNIDGYIINGTAVGVYDGVRAYLKTKDERGNFMIQDTAIVFDEKFTFSGKIVHPQMWYLSVNGIPHEVPVIIENTTISIEINNIEIQSSKIIGSK